MKKILVFLFLIKCSFSFAQNVDLTSVDEFFKIADCLKNGKEVNMEQWHRFDSSAAYSIFSDYKDNRISNIVHIPEHTRSLSGSLFGHKTMP